LLESSEQPWVIRLRELCERGATHTEIGNDPLLVETIFAGMENESSRRWEAGHVIRTLQALGILPLKKAAPKPASGDRQMDRIPEKRLSLYENKLADYEKFIGASYRRREYRPMPQVGRTTTIVISDLHIPDERTDLIADIFTRHKGARLVVAGDINDFQKYSRYEVSEMGLPDIKEAFAKTEAFLELATGHFPEVIVLFGNHDLRLERKVRKALGEDIAWLTGQGHRAIYEKRHGVKVVSHSIDRVNGRPIEDLHYWVQIGDAIICHVERAGKAHGKGVTDAHDFFYSHWKKGLLPLDPFNVVLQAHTHKMCQFEHAITGVQCCEIGALCALQAYALKEPRYSPIQNGYFELVQENGITDINASRLWRLS
jgi:predicted phosphodiesterase